MNQFIYSSLRWTIGILALAILVAGCNWFGQDSSAALFRLDITDATAVSISSNNLSNTSSLLQAAASPEDDEYSPVLIKFTHNGAVQEVSISNANHSFAYLTPVEVRLVDEQWLAVLIYTHAPVVDEDSSPGLIVFVDTNSGEAFALETDLIAEPSIYGYSAAVDGYLYLTLLGEDTSDPRGGIYRVRPGVNPVKERISRAGHRIDASSGADSVTFIVGDDGTLLYRHFVEIDLIWRHVAIHSDSRAVQELDDTVHSFWRGLDGQVYFQRQLKFFPEEECTAWSGSFSADGSWREEEYSLLKQCFSVPALTVHTTTSVLGIDRWRIKELYHTSSSQPALREHQLNNSDSQLSFDNWTPRPAFVAPVGANVAIFNVNSFDNAVIRLIEVDREVDSSAENRGVFQYQDIVPGDLDPVIEIFTIAAWDADHILVGGRLESGSFVKATVRMTGGPVREVSILDEVTGTAMRQLEHLRRGPARLQ